MKKRSTKKGPFVYMYDGKRINLRNPKQYMPYVYPFRNLFWSLSQTPRWQGWSGQTLAHHSCSVWLAKASNFKRTELLLPYFLHDAAEVFIGDIPREVKRLSPAIRALERDILIHIFKAYNVSTKYLNDPALKRADEAAFRKELKEVRQREKERKRKEKENEANKL